MSFLNIAGHFCTLLLYFLIFFYFFFSSLNCFFFYYLYLASFHRFLFSFFSFLFQKPVAIKFFLLQTLLFPYDDFFFLLNQFLNFHHGANINLAQGSGIRVSRDLQVFVCLNMSVTWFSLIQFIFLSFSSMSFFLRSNLIFRIMFTQFKMAY